MENMRIVAVLALSAILVFFSGCTGATPPIPDPVPGQVVGSILDTTNKAVNQADVRLENTICLRNQRCRSAITDTSGKFQFPMADVGLFDLVAEKTLSGIPHAARIRHLNIQGESLVARDLQMRPVGSIDGFVKLEGYTNHSGVLVQLIGTNQSVTTTAGGYFKFNNVAYTYRDTARNITYVYQIQFARDGFGLRTVDNIEVFANNNTRIVVNRDPEGQIIPDSDTMILRSLDPSGTGDIEGTVTLEARTGAEGSEIELLGTALPVVRIVSDNAGENSFKFQGVPVGTYSVEVRHPDYITKRVNVALSAGQNRVETSIGLTNVAHFASYQKAYDLVLSPGGHQIAYVKDMPSDTRAHREIYLMDNFGNNYDRRITTEAKAANEDRGMSWSWDGKYLLFVEKNENSINQFYRLVTVSSSGGFITALTPYISDVMQPAFEPRGMRVAYLKFDTVGQLALATLVSKPSGLALENETLVLSERNSQIGRNQYSSMEFGLNDRLLFTRDANFVDLESEVGVFTVPASANGNALLKFKVFGSTSANAATFNPDNSKIAYSVSPDHETPTTPRGTYMANIDGSGKQRISLAWGRALQIAPDMSRIYYIDHRPGMERRIGTVIIPERWRN